MLLKLGFQKPFPNPCLHFIEQFMRSLLIHLVKNFPLPLRAINQSLFDGIWRLLTSSHCPARRPSSSWDQWQHWLCFGHRNPKKKGSSCPSSLSPDIYRLAVKSFHNLWEEGFEKRGGDCSYPAGCGNASDPSSPHVQTSQLGGKRRE